MIRLTASLIVKFGALILLVLLFSGFTSCESSKDTVSSCKNNNDCSMGSFCKLPEPYCIGVEGHCVERPINCINKHPGYVPFAVCGCDHNFYPSPCHAWRMGVNIKKELFSKLLERDIDSLRASCSKKGRLVKNGGLREMGDAIQ